jgi:hypothetical protein
VWHRNRSALDVQHLRTAGLVYDGRLHLRHIEPLKRMPPAQRRPE